MDDKALEAEGMVVQLVGREQDARAEIERLKVERDEAWSAANSAEAALAEALKNNDPASYSSMLYWREKCYEARAALEGMVNCPVGGSGQRLPTPETVARARAAMRGEGEK